MNKLYKIGKSKIDGKGLIANQNIKAGDFIGLSHSNGKPVSDIGKFYNHSDTPNAISRLVGNRRYVIASKNIAKGGEITVDYRKQPELEQPEDFKYAEGGGLFKVGPDGKPLPLDFTKSQFYKGEEDEEEVTETTPTLPSIDMDTSGFEDLDPFGIYTDDMTPEQKHQALKDYQARDAELKEEERRSEMSFGEKVAEYSGDKLRRVYDGEDPVDVAISVLNDAGDIPVIGKLPGMIGGAADIGAGVAQGDMDRVTSGFGNIVTSGFKGKKGDAIDSVTKVAGMQDGGSLPRLKVINYPYGYRSMPPGHIEAALIDADGNYLDEYNGMIPYVNRWVDSGNKPVKYKGSNPNVRTTILELDQAEIDHFLKVAQTFTPGGKTDVPFTDGWLPTAWGGKEGDYDFINSNCADGVCKALNMDPDDYDRLGITDPKLVMDAIRKRNDVVKNTGKAVGFWEGLDRITGFSESIDDANDYLYENVTKPVNETLDDVNETLDDFRWKNPFKKRTWKSVYNYWFEDGGENEDDGVTRKGDEDEAKNAIQFMYDWTNSPMHDKMLTREIRLLNQHPDDFDYVKNMRLFNLDTTFTTYDAFNSSSDFGGTSHSYTGQVSLNKDRGDQTAVHEYSHSSDRPTLPANPANQIYNMYKSGFNWRGISNILSLGMNPFIPGAPYTGKRLIPPVSNQLSIPSYNLTENKWDQTSQGDVQDLQYWESMRDKWGDKEWDEVKDSWWIDEEYGETVQDMGFHNKAMWDNWRKKIPENIKNEKEWINYVSEPTEVRARLNAIRMKAHELGIYDVFNEPINEQQFEELLERADEQNNKPGYNALYQLRNIYPDEKIFEMLNTFSDAGQDALTPEDQYNMDNIGYDPNAMMAQDGMEVWTPIQGEGRSPEIDAFGYRGYFDFNQPPITMSDNDDGHSGYLFVYTTGPTAGGSYWRPIDKKYAGSRWEESGQVEEYEAYFKNPELIYKHWDKGSAVAEKIREAVENNVLYSELPEYLKDVNTWRTISPDRDLEKELDNLIKEQDGSEINFEDIEKGIRHIESLNGELMKNPESSASGFYGQRFSEIEYDGTRDEFIADTDYQKKLFKQRFYGELEGIPGLKDNGIDIYNEYKDQLDLELTPTQIAALSNMLGRQGTREYIGNVLRDGKTLAEVFPHLYGADKKQVNKTPDEYIKLFDEALLKKAGGEFSKKLQRLKQQMKLYEDGGVVSPLAYQELVKLKLIKPEFADGGSYTVKKGDSMSAIAKNNDMSLAELLELNPDYKANPAFVKIGANIKLSSAAQPTSTEPNEENFVTVQKGDNLSSIGSKFGVNWRDIARLNDINDPKYIIKPGQRLKMPETNSATMSPTNPTEQEILENENAISGSVYSPQGAPDPNAFSVQQDWVDWGQTDEGTYTSIGGKRNKIRDINKMDQADVIVNAMNDKHSNYSDIGHEVQSGETLSAISAKYNVPINRLMEDNNITDPNKINAGSKLKVNKSTGQPYLIVDEKVGRMHLYYPGDSEPAKSYPILTGKNTGDAQTVTARQYFDPNGNTVEATEAFEDDMETLKPGYRSKVNWNWGNKTTGAGVYTIDFANPDSGGYDDSGRGRPTPSFVLNNDNDKNVSTAIHVVSNVAGENRVDRLYDRGAYAGDQDNNESNRITNGCINGTCSAMIDLYENPDVKSGTKVFILSDNPEENKFLYENGQINFRASADEREDALTYIDEEGTERQGQGINVSRNTLDYKPINFVIDKGAIGDSETFDGSIENENMEFNTNTVPYVEALAQNKQDLMKTFGINGDRYNDLALLAFGIYGAESRLGDMNTAGENLAKYGVAGANKVLDKYLGIDLGLDTGPDTSAEWNYPGITGESNSVGPTQIVWSQLDATEKGMLNKIGIESNEDLADPATAAKATIVLLNKRLTQTNRLAVKGEKQEDGSYKFPEEYDGYLTGDGATRYLDVQKYRKSSDFDIFSFAPKLWNKADYYPGKVSKYMRFANLQETDLDGVDPEVIVKGDFKPENQNYKQVALEMLTKSPIETIGNTFDSIGNYIQTADLNPFWKSGGEVFDTNAQQRFYEEYISGAYNGTKQSNKAKKMFEKLNRMYYNDSKDNNMHPLDIIKRINQQ